MYSPHISEFSDFLATKDHTLQEILDHLERVTLNILGCNSIIFFQANQNSEFFVKGKSGVSKPAQKELGTVYDLNENYPVADAIRFGKIVWLSPSPQRLIKYPMLKDFPLLVDHHTFIASPIFQSATPVSAFAIFSDKHMRANTEAEDFLKAVSSIFALYFYRSELNYPTEIKTKISATKIQGKGNNFELTDRQLQILRLIAEEKTNLEIGDLIGFSEPAIRKDVIEIFSKLQCSNRSEATAIFRSFSKP